ISASLKAVENDLNNFVSDIGSSARIAHVPEIIVSQQRGSVQYQLQEFAAGAAGPNDGTANATEQMVVPSSFCGCVDVELRWTPRGVSTLTPVDQQPNGTKLVCDVPRRFC
ncbi:MAG: hypothetical protein ACKVP5_21290, partial [Aestuariivirga sp.]